MIRISDMPCAEEERPEGRHRHSGIDARPSATGVTYWAIPTARLPAMTAPSISTTMLRPWTCRTTTANRKAPDAGQRSVRDNIADQGLLTQVGETTERSGDQSDDSGTKKAAVRAGPAKNTTDRSSRLMACSRHERLAPWWVRRSHARCSAYLASRRCSEVKASLTVPLEMTVYSDASRGCRSPGQWPRSWCTITTVRPCWRN